MKSQPFRYKDFVVCVNCRTVNHVSTQTCRRCGSNERVTLARAAGHKWYLYILMILVLAGMSLGGVTELAVVPEAILFFFVCRYHYRLGSLEHDAWHLHVLGADESDAYLVNAHESGVVQWWQGCNDAAIQWFSVAMQGGMNPMPTRFAMAVALYNTGNHAQALPLLEEIQFSGSAPPSAGELLARTYLEVGAASAYQLNFLHDYRQWASEPRLRRRIDNFLGLPPEPMALPATGGWTPVQPPPAGAAAARSLLEQGDAAAAALLCEQASGREMAPDLLEVYTHALDALRRVDDVALQAYQKRLVSSPADLAVRLRLAQGLVTHKRHREAIAACKMGLEIQPDVRLRHELATVFLVLGNYQSALAELQAVERTVGYETFVPKGTVYRLMGRCLIGQGLLTPALRQLQQADRSQDTLDVLYELGRLLEDKGDMENARTCWEEIYVADVTYRDVALKLR